MKSSILLAIIALTTTALACTVFVGGPSYPDTPMPAPVDAPDLQTAIQTAVVEAAETGTLTIEISQSQLTSYLTSKLATEANPVITDPQVVLSDGLMIIYGKARSGVFLATVKVTTEVTLDQNGEPQIEITEADFGPFPAPAALRTAISSFLHETLTGPIGPAAIGFRLESVSIADGTMTVSGRIK